MREHVLLHICSVAYIHAYVLLHMEDAEADEHSEESAGDEDHEDNEKPKKNVKVVGA